jgi:hypothetical protein
MYIRPTHFDLPCADRLIQQLSTKYPAFNICPNPVLQTASTQQTTAIYTMPILLAVPCYVSIQCTTVCVILAVQTLAAHYCSCCSTTALGLRWLVTSFQSLTSIISYTPRPRPLLPIPLHHLPLPLHHWRPSLHQPPPIKLGPGQSSNESISI